MTDCNPAYLANVPDYASAHVTPKHYGQACGSKDKAAWKASMEEELQSLRDQGVYVFIDELPTGKKALRCLWVYKVKCGPDGKVTRFKSRLTVNGKTQEFGLDAKTFSPVAFATTIRLLLAVGLEKGYTFRQYDIKCAFLYANLPEDQEVYMHSPPGSGKKGYWKLQKSLYGLRTAPLLFNEHLNKTLADMGFVASKSDPCLYLHKDNQSMLVIVVDDMILAASSPQYAKDFYKQLSAVYDVKDLGVPGYVIGIRLGVTKDTLTFTQDRYITDLFNLHTPGETAANTPATTSETLCHAGIYQQAESPLLQDPKCYRSLVGGLMYTLVSRPDVASAVSICSRYMQSPRVAHLDAAKRVLRFLYRTKLKALRYRRTGAPITVTSLVDSSWANDVDTRRSRFGFAIYVNNCLVAWRSKLHPAIALSSAEAEYTAATEAAKSITWIVSLMRFLRAMPQLPVRVFEDNAACRIMASTKQVSGRNKHFELRQHYIRSEVAKGNIAMVKVATADQVADIFTKTLARPAFEKHAASLMEGLPTMFAGTSD
jgi:hypothetical protein